jgi:cyclopropane fatty-acyl-phospholipid synthase-like methyltransferase
LPDIIWQSSDVADNLPGISYRVDAAVLPNLPPPQELDVLASHWPDPVFDAVFSANTAHIMCWSAVEAMFAGVEKMLALNGPFLLYGPFNYDGLFTSEGNRQLDSWARETFPGAGLRDFETICKLAARHDLAFEADVSMPANNRLLVFRQLTNLVTAYQDSIRT